MNTTDTEKNQKLPKWIPILFFSILAFIIFGSVAFILMMTQPWQPKVLVLSTKIPSTTLTVELWERLEQSFPEDHWTALAILSEKGKREWHIIDEQYTTFQYVVLLLSDDGRYLRIEDGPSRNAETSIIAEYDFKTKTLRAGNADYLSKKEDCKVIAEKQVRD